MQKTLAFSPDAPAFLVIECALDEEAVLQVFEPFFDSGDIIDAVLAKSDTESADMWRVREDSQSGFRRLLNPMLFDISIPLGQLDAYMLDLQQQLDAMRGEIELQALAHLGDGNIHLSMGRQEAWSEEEADALSKAVERGVKSMGGAISAEHGIGTAKLDTFNRNTSEASLAAMRAIKAALDPKGILNPGKVLSA